MKLISIGDKNILINPQQITCVEQRSVGITTVIYVWVGDKQFVLGMSLDEFFKILDDVDTKQFFGG